MVKLAGGRPFSRGILYLILQNHLYHGEVEHKGNVYPGQHEAIVDARAMENRPGEAGRQPKGTRSLRRRRSLQRRRNIAVLPRAAYRLVPLDVPDLPREEWRQAVRWQLKDLVDFAVETASVDVLEIPGDPARRRTPQLLAAPRDSSAGIRSAATRRRRGTGHEPVQHIDGRVLGDGPGRFAFDDIGDEKGSAAG